MGRASWIGRTYQRVSGIWATPDDQKAQLPDVLHEQLLEIFHHAEAHGEWLQQLLNGGVHSLEKVANTQTVSQYRPITIMPCAHRIYTTLRSREVLRHLARVTPPTLLGNIPGKQATTLWWPLVTAAQN